MYDTIIKNAYIVDGTGASPVHGDVALQDGCIAGLGKIAGEAARETIDAAGRLVAPGFVDIHTHYDGQVTWDTEVKPSSDHGVTTVVMGNCGVGFAPVRPGQEDWLIELMEGVEDIPGSALTEGMTWGWETFPEYLNVLARRELEIDVAAQIPHGAVRAYVMGERGANNERATPDEIAAMASIVSEAITAGAVGFSTSRVMSHQALDGRQVPGTMATEDELMAIARGMRLAGKGVFELVPSGTLGELTGVAWDPFTVQQEMSWMRRFAEESGRPLTFALMQVNSDPENYRDLIRIQDEATAAGIAMHGQFSCRPGGVLTSLQTYHCFEERASYKKIAHLPVAQRAAEMRKPEVRAAILAEPDVHNPQTNNSMPELIRGMLPFIYPLNMPLDYEPEAKSSIAAEARRRGIYPLAYMYDLLTAGDGTTVFVALVNNFAGHDHGAIEYMLRNPNTMPGLADGGAHVRLICDASIPTFLLTHWARDRKRGPRIPVELLIKKQSNDTARLYGLNDRGTLEVGKRADLNVIDFDALTLSVPFVAPDLPGGGERYLQGASGYDFTFVKGVATRRNGKETGERPGRLARSGG